MVNLTQGTYVVCNVATEKDMQSPCNHKKVSNRVLVHTIQLFLWLKSQNDWKSKYQRHTCKLRQNQNVQMNKDKYKQYHYQLWNSCLNSYGCFNAWVLFIVRFEELTCIGHILERAKLIFSVDTKSWQFHRHCKLFGLSWVVIVFLHLQLKSKNLQDRHEMFRCK